MSLLDRITLRPDQCGGRPCIRGLRLRVSDVLGMMAGGALPSEILADFPYLQPEDLQAVLAWAAAQADHAIVRAA